MPRVMRAAERRANDPMLAPSERARAYVEATRTATPQLRGERLPPSNQIAEAGDMAFESTGLPAMRRGTNAFAGAVARTEPVAGWPALGEFALGAGTLATWGLPGGGRGAPRAPMRPTPRMAIEPPPRMVESPRPALSAPDAGPVNGGGALEGEIIQPGQVSAPRSGRDAMLDSLEQAVEEMRAGSASIRETLGPEATARPMRTLTPEDFADDPLRSRMMQFTERLEDRYLPGGSPRAPELPSRPSPDGGGASGGSRPYTHEGDPGGEVLYSWPDGALDISRNGTVNLLNSRGKTWSDGAVGTGQEAIRTFRPALRALQDDMATGLRRTYHFKPETQRQFEMYERLLERTPDGYEAQVHPSARGGPPTISLYRREHPQAPPARGEAQTPKPPDQSKAYRRQKPGLFGRAFSYRGHA